jgi:hypothetical protein
VERTVFHSSGPFLCNQFSKYVLVPDVHAEAQKWLVHLLHDLEKQAGQFLGIVLQYDQDARLRPTEDLPLPERGFSIQPGRL